MTVLLLLFVTCCGRYAGQQTETDYQTTNIFTMGTVFEIRVYDDGNAGETIQEAGQALYACEDRISWRVDGSLPDQFNRTHDVDVSDIREMMETALAVSLDSGGAFDMTVLPLSKLWDFDRMGDSEFDLSEMCVPDGEAIEAARQKVDYTQLTYDADSGRLTTENPDLMIELGAIGKGYAIDKAMEVLKASEASGGMISAGSSICVYGQKPDGSDFRVALRDPRGEIGDSIGILKLSDCTISTSGDYERYFEQDGVRYHHILDPRTGYPADSGLMQATIICDDSVLGDALSTACFVLGLDDGMALAKKYGVLAIFVDTDKNIWYNNSDALEMFEFYGQDAGYVLCEYNQAAASAGTRFIK